MSKGHGWRRRALVAAASALGLAALAIVTNIATTSPPAWLGWLKPASHAWATLGGLVVAVVILAIASVRVEEDPPGGDKGPGPEDGEPPGRLGRVGVPPLPLYRVRRDEAVSSVRKLLLDQAGTGVVGIAGMSGLGKTMVAVMVTADAALLEQFADGVVWLPIGRRDTITTIRQADLLAVLKGSRPAVDDAWSGRLALSAATASRSLLVVLDDVLDGRPARGVRQPGPGLPGAGHLAGRRHRVCCRLLPPS